MNRLDILVIEDDEVLGKVLIRHIRNFGYKPELIPNGREGLKEALSNKYDLMIVDIALPELSGLNIVKEVKDKGLSIPVLVVTHERTLSNESQAYEYGGNIFHPKPINFELLEVQINSLLKFYRSIKPIDLGRFVLDPESRQLIFDNKSLKLTPKEFRMLSALSKNPGVVMERQELINVTFKGSCEKTVGCIDTLVSRLRRKIAALDQNINPESFIETVHGHGYRVTVNREQ